MTPLLLAFGMLAQVSYTDSACTMPDLFRSTTWQDNVMGNVTFTTWKMSGWSVQTGVDEWEIVDNVKFAEEGYLALRSLATFEDNGTVYYSYMCLKFERMTYAIYKYYLLHDQEPLANNNRVLLATHDDLTMFEEICDVNYVIDKKLFGVFIRGGQQPSFTCPNAILTNFKYEVTLPDNSVVCTPAQTAWQGCSNKRQIALANVSCNHPVAFSESGKLNCLTGVSEGGLTTVMLMNTDASVDNVNTFRFACVISKDDGTEMVISPRQCYPGQTEAVFPLDRDGNLVGQRIQTSKIDSECRLYPDNGGDDDGLLSTPAIVGIVVGALVFLVLVLAAICFFVRMRKDRG